MKKHVLHTFDYELFLGAKSGNPTDCILTPTTNLLKVLDRHKVKGIFFVDTLYLWRLQNENDASGQTMKDYTAIVNQLQTMVANGHYIFPHLHPHWLDAKYIAAANEWDLSNTEHYRFASLPENKRIETFDISVNIIRNITNKIDPHYTIDSYRAGGWSIQPFELFEPLFRKHTIKYDFSVIPGNKVISSAHVYDFTKAPFKAFYNFNTKVEEEDVDGKYTELTISSIYLTFFQDWIFYKISGLKKRLGLNAVEKGQVLGATLIEEYDIYQTTTRRINLSIEQMNVLFFFLFLKKIIRSSYSQFISHPKILTGGDLIWFNIILYCIKPFKINTDYKKVI